ncbi:hypothetical protein C0J52_09803 [Blattella germanica]|nr:hypothetical protein C0J52_09803 [Blattella germanica]
MTILHTTVQVNICRNTTYKSGSLKRNIKVELEKEKNMKQNRGYYFKYCTLLTEVTIYLIFIKFIVPIFCEVH